MWGKKAAERVNAQSVSDIFPADVPLTSWKGRKEELWLCTQKRVCKTEQELHKSTAGGVVHIQVCSLVPFYSVCVCLHQLLAHMVTHYGWHVIVSIFTPLSLIVAIHFFLLPANLLPHNFCCLGDIWYPDIWINPTTLPPPLAPH